MATNKNNDRTKKPNFLFIITDQQRADWLGCMGHPVVRTPNIDSIALQGTAFEDFHVALPVCMPNRASLMTGRMPSVNGLRYNGCALSRKANTFVDVLRRWWIPHRQYWQKPFATIHRQGTGWARKRHY